VTSSVSQHRDRKRRAHARHFRKIDAAISDQIAQSPAESFPASTFIGSRSQKNMPTRPKRALSPIRATWDVDRSPFDTAMTRV
jgi:hypothetical protein